MELLITLAILGILAAIGVPILTGNIRTAKNADAQNTLRSIFLMEKKEITPATTLSDSKTLALKYGSLKKPQKPRTDKGQKFSFKLTIDSTLDAELFITELMEHIEQYEGVTVKVH